MIESLNIQHIITDLFHMYLPFFYRLALLKYAIDFVFFCFEVPVCSLLVMPFPILKNDWFIMIKLKNKQTKPMI